MRTLSIPEYGRIPYSELGAAAEPLRILDQSKAKRSADTALDWSRRDFVQARNLVGVLQAGGLAIEILPKVDNDPSHIGTRHYAETPQGHIAQRNLLYMMLTAQSVPFHERGLADLVTTGLSLIDMYVVLFGQHLLRELRRGLDHSYVLREENSPCVKGRILLADQLRTNLVRQDRSYVAFDEFTADTSLNRVIKACCRYLTRTTENTRAQQILSECVGRLAEVSDAHRSTHEFARVSFHRGNERFEPLFEFAKLVLLRRTPDFRAGELTTTFSLLVPMEELFEKFVAAFVLRHADDVGCGAQLIRRQAIGARRYLLTTDTREGRFLLKPDLVFELDGRTTNIVDTKWKRLTADVEDACNGVSQADVYQLAAYAVRYECNDCLLLYPRVPGVSDKVLLLVTPGLAARIRIGSIDVKRDFIRDKAGLIADLRRVLQSCSSSNIRSV